MLVVWLQIFRAKKMPKEKAPCKCLSIIMLHSVINIVKKIYKRPFLSTKLELFIMLIAALLVHDQKWILQALPLT